MTLPRSVLVVDDSQVQREHIGSLCRCLGVAHVHEAEHGVAALAQLARLDPPPEAMIIDLEMPVMDGVELIQQLRRVAPRIPFIVASTRDAALVRAVEGIARLQGLPVVNGLRKPLDGAGLQQALLDLAGTPPGADPNSAQAPPAAPIDPAALADAISNGAIVAHYQPKVDAPSGVIRGVEALARWTGPAGGPSPDRFIAAAEAHGLIHPLTVSIAGAAFEQLSGWNAHGLALSLAVNLSPRLLESPGFVDELVALAARWRLAPAQIVFEVTETSALAAHGAALGALTRLRLKGFGLSIDDYGTGFSSMQQLSRVPWTELKIDRSFVDGAHRSEHQCAILQSAIEMASRLQLTSVAEGVETLADWRLVQHFGCSVGQGWLFGRAMPGSELPGWIRRHALRLPEWRAPAVVSGAPRPTDSAVQGRTPEADATPPGPAPKADPARCAATPAPPHAAAAAGFPT